MHDMTAFNYKLIIAYDGTAYSGWQMQPNAISIQELFENALHTLTREKVRLIGSGRTDAGVHARGQVAHFKCSKALDLGYLFCALNGILPIDIRLLHIESAPLTFHAQRSALRKIYHYNLCFEPVVLPFDRLYRYHFRKAVSLDLLQEAARLFVGTHDFTSFANSGDEGACRKNPVRTIYRLDVVKQEQGVRLEFEGNGFLYKMVRNIVGMLLNVASGKRSINEIETLFQAKDRRLAPQSAPAQGLFLMKVFYPHPQ